MKKTSGKNNRKADSFKVLLLVSISRLTALMSQGPLWNSEILSEFNRKPTSG